MKFFQSINAFSAIVLLSAVFVSAEERQPNVIIILSDDQGWGDVGFNGGTDIPTPHLDRLADSGVRFEQGYASHPYCSPSRAGLLSGRHQQRFGHENNIPYVGATIEDGLPLDEVLISELLQQNGYKTCAVGKWHLGDHEVFWPSNRGFDDWYGFFGGGYDYWADARGKDPIHGVLRDGEIVPEEEQSYLTDDFSNEAVRYIEEYEENDDQPFFMYLAYNAPHAPIQATREYLGKVDHIEDGKRAAYAAMVVGMDHGIGKVIDALKKTGEYENTLIFFYSDNGGHIHGASNHPFRGHKGMLFEGGIRVPFLVSWPEAISGGLDYPHSITALDIFPTILAAAGVSHPNEEALDGKDLIPYLNDGNREAPHDTLFWRYSDGAGYAVRDQNYKLVKSGYKGTSLLFDIERDPFEHTDLAAKMPEKVAELKQLYVEWEKGMVPAKWYDPHAENVKKEEAIRQSFLDAASSGERAK